MTDNDNDNDNVETGEQVEKEAPKPAATIAKLCKGAMPMALVWYIKFHESHDNKSDVARKYFTTVGKISDIQTGANQKYIVEQMVWSGEELAAAHLQIDANFVRGQDNPDLKPGRGLATTSADDSEYSHEALTAVGELDLNGVTLAEARASYNAANPRAARVANPVDATDESEDTTDEQAEVEDDLEGL